MYTSLPDPMSEKNGLRRPKFGTLLRSDEPTTVWTDQEDNSQSSNRSSSASDDMMSGNKCDASSYLMSPWNHASPYINSPWTQSSPSMLRSDDDDTRNQHGLIGSLVREEGHVYSLAASGEFLYTGSDSKNIRVWRDLKEFSGFKSNSTGLVKAIVVSGNKIFTGHQDGKIRVWRFSPTNPKAYKRVGTLPTIRDFIKRSIRPKNYVRVRRHRNVPWIKHFDAVSCMSLDEEHGLLYSGSWDKTLKVWRISDSKCLESINAHGDAVNAVAVLDGLVFTGSADGTVKVWQRREQGNYFYKHALVQVLLKHGNAVTALAVNGRTVYCGTSDGLVSFWERGKQLMSTNGGGVLRGHKQAVLCLAAAGNLVLSGSADKSICVWRRQGGVHTCLCVLTGHGGPVKCLAAEEDHDQEYSYRADRRWKVYSGSLDKSVKVWRVSEDAPDLKQMQRK